MLRLQKKYIILLFNSLLLALPIVNGLHFLLVDHSNTNDFSKNKVTHHCDDFVQHHIYVFGFESTEIQAPNWTNTNFPIQVVYQINYHFDFIIELNNKGPPSFDLQSKVA